MNDDFKDLLNKAQVKHVDWDGLPLEEQRAESVKEAPDTALVVDPWTRRRAEELMGEMTEDGSATRLAAALFPGLEDPLNNAEDGPWSDACTAVADFHAAAFELEPQLHETCRDGRRHQFVKGLLETPDYQALHAATALDVASSELATVAFAEQYGELLRRDAEREEKDRQDPKRKSHPMKAEVDCSAAASRACARASEDVESYGEMCRGLGGGGGGSLRKDPKKALAVFQKARNDRRLKAILERLGPWRRAMQARQRQKTRHGYEDMVGVTLGGDAASALPNELAQLADPDLEDDALRRLAEGQFLCRQYKGLEPKGKGPVVVVVDESGSMDNAKGYDAKGLTLALGQMARAQKRWCALCGFAGATDGNWVVFRPDGQAIRPVGKGIGTVPPEDALVAWLCHFYGGGTDCDVPLRELPFSWWPRWETMGLKKGKTDLVLVTDAEVNVPEQVRDDFLAWKKKEQVRCVTIVLGMAKGHAPVGAKHLAQVSDEIYSMPALTLDDEDVGRVLSI